jgi:putative tricarboxylic transport membrane protein
MEALASLLQGLAVATQPMNLLYALIGVLLGTAVGVLPGIGPALTVALLLPITFKLDPAGSLIMFAGIYYGGMYGGSTTSILINTPGESASMVTALEGNKMAKAGRGGPALATAAIGSFVAGTLATLGIVFLAPWLVQVAITFGPEDYFALMCLAFVTVSATFGSSPIRGLTSLFIGLTLGLVGIDKLTGQSRLSFGVPDLLDGVEVTTLAVGLFAVGEALYVASRRHLIEEKLEPVRGSLWMTASDWARSWKPWLRGTLFGFPIGALPAGGAEIPTFLSYSAERRLSKHPEEFGKGAIEGVAGPEAANNASAAGTLVPLLTLGLPTSATAAMMLAAIRPQSRAAAVRRKARLGLGADREPVHRQRHAAGAQPAAGRPLGAAPRDPDAVALRRHSGFRDHGDHRGQALGGRTVDARGLRRNGFPDAAV